MANLITNFSIWSYNADPVEGKQFYRNGALLQNWANISMFTNHASYRFNVLYKFKTGIQWNQLPVKALFFKVILSWQSVYHHYRKWCLSGAWENRWAKILGKYRAELNLSSVDLEGSHMPAIRGGHGVEYQGRKRRKTTNALYLTNKQELPLAMSEPVAGNHNDLYVIKVQFEIATTTLQ